MADIKSGEIVTANGSYDLRVKPGFSYALEVFYITGTGTFQVQVGVVGERTDDFQNAQQPDSTSDWSIQATGTYRSARITPTGNRIRLVLSSASSLEAIVKCVEIPHGR